MKNNPNTVVNAESASQRGRGRWIVPFVILAILGLAAAVLCLRGRERAGESARGPKGVHSTPGAADGSGTAVDGAMTASTSNAALSPASPAANQTNENAVPSPLDERRAVAATQAVSTASAATAQRHSAVFGRVHRPDGTGVAGIRVEVRQLSFDPASITRAVDQTAVAGDVTDDGGGTPFAVWLPVATWCIRTSRWATNAWRRNPMPWFWVKVKTPRDVISYCSPAT